MEGNGTRNSAITRHPDRTRLEEQGVSPRLVSSPSCYQSGIGARYDPPRRGFPCNETISQISPSFLYSSVANCSRSRVFSSFSRGRKEEGGGVTTESISSLRQSWTISWADRDDEGIGHPPISIPLEISLLDARLEECWWRGGDGEREREREEAFVYDKKGGNLKIMEGGRRRGILYLREMEILFLVKKFPPLVLFIFFSFFGIVSLRGEIIIRRS